MNQRKVYVTTGGISLSTVAFVVLLILKITGNIAMSWFWVLTSFIWIPVFSTLVILVAGFGILIFAALIWSIIYFVAKFSDRTHRGRR